MRCIAQFDQSTCSRSGDGLEARKLGFRERESRLGERDEWQRSLLGFQCSKSNDELSCIDIDQCNLNGMGWGWSSPE